MEYRLWLTPTALERALLAAGVRTPRRAVRLPAALSLSQGRAEALVSASAPPRVEASVLVWTFSDVAGVPEPVDRSLLEDDASLVLGLGIGVGEARGRAMGLVRTSRLGALAPLARVGLVGPGLPVQRLTGEADPVPADLHSRVVGTLGLEVWRRLQGLHVGVVGAGGLGSVLGEHLARLMGPGGELTLVDPDVLGVENLSCWAGVTRWPDDDGAGKASTLAAWLRTLPGAPSVVSVDQEASGWEARSRLKRCDVLVCAVDDPAGRFACGLLATLYLRPLLVLETGVFLADSAEGHARRLADSPERPDPPEALLSEGVRTRLADVRLVLPDGPGASCLLCAGGIGSELWEASSRRRRGAFWRERAGSSFSLNQEAVSRGVRLLLSLLDGTLASSTHLRLDDYGEPTPNWFTVASPGMGRVACPLCARRGLGDLGWTDPDVALRVGAVDVRPLYNPLGGGWR